MFISNSQIYCDHTMAIYWYENKIFVHLITDIFSSVSELESDSLLELQKLLAEL